MWPYPIATPPPMVRFRTCVVFSMRSAAAFSAFATAVWVALARSAAATRRLMAALEALESAVERRREADRDENELASRIQALGADRSRLADELDGSLVKSRRLERVNREIADRLDAAIGTIRSVLHAGEDS